MVKACEQSLGQRLEAIDQNIGSLGVRVSKLETSDERVKALEDRMRKLLEELNKQGTRRSQSAGSFEPLLIEIKATRFVDRLRQELPPDLQGYLREFKLAGIFRFEIRVRTTPQYTLQLKGCISDILKTGNYKVNYITPYVVAQTPMEVRRQYHKFGNITEANEKAVTKKDGKDMAIEWSAFSCYVKVPTEERPFLIGEVTDRGDLVVNVRNTI
ncbi:unnamed protein product, partial [Prorocentrum cordatum]